MSEFVRPNQESQVGTEALAQTLRRLTDSLTSPWQVQKKRVIRAGISAITVALFAACGSSVDWNGSDSNPTNDFNLNPTRPPLPPTSTPCPPEMLCTWFSYTPQNKVNS